MWLNPKARKLGLRNQRKSYKFSLKLDQRWGAVHIYGKTNLKSGTIAGSRTKWVRQSILNWQIGLFSILKMMWVTCRRRKPLAVWPTTRSLLISSSSAVSFHAACPGLRYLTPNDLGAYARHPLSSIFSTKIRLRSGSG